jgi:hypothetical protein
MLGEFTGILQIGTCLCMCVATAIWLKVLSLNNKMMFETRQELLKAEMKIYSLENKVQMLLKLANTNHEIEVVRETLANLHSKE